MGWVPAVNRFNLHVLLHFDFVGGVLDAVSDEKLAKVLVVLHDTSFGEAEWEAIVLDGVLIMD